jgi:hypothetical protein
MGGSKEGIIEIHRSHALSCIASKEIGKGRETTVHADERSGCTPLLFVGPLLARSLELPC